MAGSTLQAVPTPRVPQLFYRFEIAGTEKEDGGDFQPGFDSETQGQVAFISMEYEDTWHGLDSCTFVFEDPNRVLIDHPLLRPLSTKVTFSFGYAQGFGETVGGRLQSTMSHCRVMTLVRSEQNYPQSGKVVTTLRFFSSGVKLSHLRRNFTYRHLDQSKRGVVKLKATEVAERIAKKNGLNPVITEARVATGSAKELWKQTNQTDMEFLREIGLPLRAAGTEAGGREGAFQAMIRDNSLIFGPISIDEEVLATFTYKGPNSPILNFRPKHPSDIMKGIGWITGYTGYDTRTGGVSLGGTDTGAVTNQNDEGQHKMGAGQTQGETGEKGVGRETDNHAPTFQRTEDPEAERRRTSLEAEASIIKNNIDRKRADLLAVGTAPDVIEDELTQLRADLDEVNAKIDAIGTGDETFIVDESPNAESNRTKAENFQRQAQLNALTADLEIFGFPAIEAGVAVGVDNVAELFQGKWWVKKATHRIDRTTGYVTRMDMQKNALGIPNPAPGSPAETKRPDRETETVRITTLETGEERTERRAASTVNEMNRSTQRTDPTQNNRQRQILLQAAQAQHSAFPADASRTGIPSTVNADQANSVAAQEATKKGLGG